MLENCILSWYLIQISSSQQWPFLHTPHIFSFSNSHAAAVLFHKCFWFKYRLDSHADFKIIWSSLLLLINIPCHCWEAAMVTCRSVQERNSGRPTQKGRAEKAADLYLEKNPSQTYRDNALDFKFASYLILNTYWTVHLLCWFVSTNTW